MMPGYVGWWRLLVVALTLVTPCAAGAGDNNEPDASEQWLLTQPARLGAGLTAPLAELRGQLEQIFDEQDLQGVGITNAVREALQALPEAQQRGRLIGEALAFDLNGDGSITRQELALAMGGRARRYINANGAKMRPTQAQVAVQLEKLIADKLKADANGDGVLTLDELERTSKNEARRWSLDVARLIPPDFDADKDGTVSRAEYTAVVDRLLARIDANGDGLLDGGEVGRAVTWQRDAREASRLLVLQQQKKIQLQERVSACALPAPSPDAQIVVLAAAGGTAAVDVVWLPQASAPADYAAIDIAPGQRPLYIVVTSLEQVVWQVTGATQRVERLVIGGAGAQRKATLLAGVVGLDKSRVVFAPESSCPAPALRNSLGERVRLKNEAAALLAREPDEIVQLDRFAKVTLPGGASVASLTPEAVRSLPSSEAVQLLRQEFLSRYPAGVAHVAADVVIASVGVMQAPVLPAQAGLAELIEQGAVELTRQDQVTTLDTTRGQDVPAGAGVTDGAGQRGGDGQQPRKQLPVYGKVQQPAANEAQPRVPRITAGPASQMRILRKITMPAGLKRAHGLVFMLPEGVPEPDGLTDNICVYREPGNQPLRPSPYCRPRPR